MVVPDAHDENHAAVHGPRPVLTKDEILLRVLLLKIFLVSEAFPESLARFVGDGAELFGHGVNSGLLLALEDFGVLDVKSPDLNEVFCTCCSMEGV